MKMIYLAKERKNEKSITNKRKEARNILHKISRGKFSGKRRKLPEMAKNRVRERERDFSSV